MQRAQSRRFLCVLIAITTMYVGYAPSSGAQSGASNNSICDNEGRMGNFGEARHRQTGLPIYYLSSAGVVHAETGWGSCKTNWMPIARIGEERIEWIQSYCAKRTLFRLQGNELIEVQSNDCNNSRTVSCWNPMKWFFRRYPGNNPFVGRWEAEGVGSRNSNCRREM